VTSDLDRPATAAATPEAPSPQAVAIGSTLAALLLALALGSLLIFAYGERPLRVYGLLVAGTWFSLGGIGQVLFKATPLVFTGLSVTLALRAGLFNVGAEGQLVAGAFACALVGLVLPAATPAALALPLAVLAAFAGGAVTGLLPGWLKSRFGAHEVINTIMLNFLVVALTGYLVTYHLHVKESVHTAPIIAAAQLPRLGSLLADWRGSAVNGAVVLALLAAAGVHHLLFRTGFGLAVRATGLSPDAARTAGLPAGATVMTVMALSGGLAGLGATSFVLGYKHYFEEGFSGGLGFQGIAVALLARNRPLPILLAALFFGTLSHGALVINRVVAKELVDVLQAVVILAVAGAQVGLSRYLAKEPRA
jgi:simple sugar transport system permease protein